MPRLGFVGVGWIGRNRMEAVRDSGVAEVTAVADSAPDVLAEVQGSVGAEGFGRFADLLDADLDGIVIATPSALHAEQAVAALDRGLAVFCQKPLARTAAEAREVLDAARANDRLLGVDLSYRFTRALTEMRTVLSSGAIGNVFAADLSFHNAYGPNKPWFLDPALAGGGCAIDLGTHLVDAALWMLDWPVVERVDAALFRHGRRLEVADEVEDYATATLDLAGGCRARMACSWFLSAGRPARIEMSFYGERGSVSMRNVDGSFYDFVAERWDGTTTTPLAAPPDAWGGRAVVEWARRLSLDPSFDPEVLRALDVADVLDRVYGRSS